MEKIKIADIRAKFPMYADLPDDQLLIGIRKKFYPDIPMGEFSKRVEYTPVDPTDGMSTLEKANAGIGKAFADLGLGIKQKLGMASYGDVAESRRLDKPLMSTAAGVVGNVGGNMALLAPSTLLPGVSTVPAAAAISGVAGALAPAENALESYLNPALSAAGGAAGQWAANGAAGSQASQQVENARKFALGSQKANAAKSAMDAGYVIPPADLKPGMVAEAASGLSGKIKTAQVASQRNQGVTDALARKAIGLNATDELTPDVLQGIRRAAAASGYDPVKSAGTVAADSQFFKALDDIAKTQQGASRSFPGLAENGVTELVAKLKQPAFDAGDAIDATKVLREAADQAYRSGNSALGKANKSAADALESMLERHLQGAGQPDALKAFQDARQLIAKTYTVQKGLNSETGSVAANKLAAELAKGKPLTGDLRTIAEAATAFGKATQSLKEAPKALSPLDFAVAIGSAASSGNVLPLTLLGARPAVRGALLSQPVQRNALAAMLRPEEVDLLTRALANNRLTMPAGAVAGMAGANALATRERASQR